MEVALTKCQVLFFFCIDDLRKYNKHNSLLWIRDILVRIRIRGSVPLTFGSGSCFLSSVADKMPTKNFFEVFLLITVYLFNVHLHLSSKTKSQKEAKK
jgi:hypothetical protein